MYTLSGVAVGAGIGVAPALVIAKKKNEYAFVYRNIKPYYIMQIF